MRTLLIAAAMMGAAGCSTASPSAPVTDRQSDNGPPDRNDEIPSASPDAEARGQIKLLDELEKMNRPPEADFSNATLGKALRMKVVKWDGLKTYAGGTDPRSLIESEGQATWFYPALVDGRMKKAIVMRYDSRLRRWSPSFGYATIATRIETVSSHLTSANGKEIALVDIPGLFVHFVSVDDGANLELIPLQDVPDTSLRYGKAVKGADAFKELQIAAAKL